MSDNIRQVTAKLLKMWNIVKAAQVLDDSGYSADMYGTDEDLLVMDSINEFTEASRTMRVVDVERNKALLDHIDQYIEIMERVFREMAAEGIPVPYEFDDDPPSTPPTHKAPPKHTILKVLDDVADDSVPKNTDAWNKGPLRLDSGQRIGWWHTEDEKHAGDIGETLAELKASPPYQGVVVPVEDTVIEHGGIPVEHMIVVMDKYPVVQFDLEATWIPYRGIVDNDTVVQIVKL